jgi:GH18 family chitinase
VYRLDTKLPARLTPLTEIFRIIQDNDLVKTYDDVAAVNWISWNDDQWVSYDDGESMQAKLQKANDLVSSISGIIVTWANL